jgi:hypothetical protein
MVLMMMVVSLMATGAVVVRIGVRGLGFVVIDVFTVAARAFAVAVAVFSVSVAVTVTFAISVFVVVGVAAGSAASVVFAVTAASALGFGGKVSTRFASAVSFVVVLFGFVVAVAVG